MRARGFRVESICRVLSEQGVAVAPRTYRNWKTAKPSARTVTDAHLTDALRATIGTPEGLYGRRKMTAYLRRQGYRVAACTVDRPMGDEGLSGVIRGRRHRTTIPGGKDSRRAADLLDRDFTAEAPNRKWVTDFTYTRAWAGFVYVALVIDCFSRAIVGWHASSVKDTALVITALKMALWRRDHTDRRVGDGLIHHSDAGSPSTRRSHSPKPLCWKGLRHRLAASAMPTTTRWPRRRLGCSKPKPSDRQVHSAPGRCAPSTMSNTRPWNGLTGTTTAACTASSTTSHPRSTGPPTTLEARRRSQRRVSR